MKGEYKILTIGIIAITMLAIVLTTFWYSLLFFYPSTGFYIFYTKMDYFNEFWLEFILFHGFGIVVLWFMKDAFKNIKPKKRD